jgi:hypothetical protein
MGAFAKALGPVAVAVDVGFSVKRVLDAPPERKVRVLAQEAAGIIGGYSLAAAGAALGTLVCPGVGTLVGAIIGGVIGRVVATLAVDAVADKIGEPPKGNETP